MYQLKMKRVGSKPRQFNFPVTQNSRPKCNKVVK